MECLSPRQRADNRVGAYTIVFDFEVRPTTSNANIFLLRTERNGSWKHIHGQSAININSNSVNLKKKRIHSRPISWF